MSEVGAVILNSENCKTAGNEDYGSLSSISCQLLGIYTSTCQKAHSIVLQLACNDKAQY